MVGFRFCVGCLRHGCPQAVCGLSPPPPRKRLGRGFRIGFVDLSPERPLVVRALPFRACRRVGRPWTGCREIRHSMACGVVSFPLALPLHPGGGLEHLPVSCCFGPLLLLCWDHPQENVAGGVAACRRPSLRFARAGLPRGQNGRRRTRMAVYPRPDDHRLALSPILGLANGSRGGMAEWPDLVRFPGFPHTHSRDTPSRTFASARGLGKAASSLCRIGRGRCLFVRRCLVPPQTCTGHGFGFVWRKMTESAPCGTLPPSAPDLPGFRFFLSRGGVLAKMAAK